MDISLRKWLSNEEEMKQLREKINKMREEQQILEQDLIKNIKSNNLENNMFKIGNKKIKLKTYKNYSTITNTYLMDTFKQFMDDDNSNMLLEYIRENRPYKTITEIKLLE
jgi:hypothetical protein